MALMLAIMGLLRTSSTAPSMPRPAHMATKVRLSRARLGRPKLTLLRPPVVRTGRRSLTSLRVSIVTWAAVESAETAMTSGSTHMSSDGRPAPVQRSWSCLSTAKRSSAVGGMPSSLRHRPMTGHLYFSTSGRTASMRDCSPLIELMNGTLPPTSMTARTPASRAVGLAESTMSCMSVTLITVSMSQMISATSSPPATPPLTSSRPAPASTWSVARVLINSASRAWIASATCLRVPLIDSPINNMCSTSTTNVQDERPLSICEYANRAPAEKRRSGASGRTPRLGEAAPSGRRHQPVGRDAAPLARTAPGGDLRAVPPSLRDTAVLDDLDALSPPEEPAKTLVEPVAPGARHHERVRSGVDTRIHAVVVPTSSVGDVHGLRAREELDRRRPLLLECVGAALLEAAEGRLEGQAGGRSLTLTTPASMRSTKVRARRRSLVTTLAARPYPRRWP